MPVIVVIYYDSVLLIRVPVLIVYVPMDRENLLYKFAYSIGTNFADDLKKSCV